MQPIDGMALLRSYVGLMRLVADTLGLSRGAVSQWERVPAEYLPHVERITGIPRWALRPDIVPPPQPFDAPPWPPEQSELPRRTRRRTAAPEVCAEPAPETV